MEQNESYLSVEQLCKKLGVSRMTVFNWRKDGMPYKKMGEKLIRFDLKEVEKWLESRNKEEEPKHD